MSRTYRRKNDHNEKEYLEYWLDFFERKDNGKHSSTRGMGQYHGMSKEQREKKLRALYHNDSIHPFNLRSLPKKAVNNQLRNINKQELFRALQNGSEEDLVLTESRELYGWWYWYY